MAKALVEQGKGDEDLHMTQNECQSKRSAGVLLHISSLPSPYGIGSFGETAFRWIDFLVDAGQHYWQILPLGPTGKGDSPYQSFSAFAGNPYFIDLDMLWKEGLLDRDDYAGLHWRRFNTQTDYGMVYRNRELVLRKAFSRFSDTAAIDEFIERNHWFENYGLFLLCKNAQKLKPWMEWDESLRTRQSRALENIKEKYQEDYRYHAFAQYQFKRQWNALRAYANAKGIEIIGDIPIYVSLDSTDVWIDPDIFQLGKDGYPLEISGCPPDSFSSEGQLWGNPLYDWQEMAKTDYHWWIQRLKSSFELYDALRLDHFRGLESYFAIPFNAMTATDGIWKTGPGEHFIDAVKTSFPDARIIAEDLGFLTKEVYDLLEYSGYPGMKLLQYAFDTREAGNYIPYRYTANSVVYTGTHDNDTIKGWGADAPPDCVRDAMEYMGLRRKIDLTDGMIRLAMQSQSDLAIIQFQDWLKLGSRARMNTPSTVGGNNWKWRMRKNDMNGRLAGKMARMTHLFGR